MAQFANESLLPDVLVELTFFIRKRLESPSVELCQHPRHAMEGHSRRGLGSSTS
jgi:hypothetical protein